MRSYKAEGIIIRRREIGEADRLLTIFTRRYGKVKVIAKGVRRIKSRRGGHVELFNLVTVSLYRGARFDTLTEAEVCDTFPRIRENLDLIGLAYYVCELIDGLCAEHQPNQRVYELLLATMRELDSGIIARFEQTLLSELGFLPRHVPATRINATSFIEGILERKVKSKAFLEKLS